MENPLITNSGLIPMKEMQERRLVALHRSREKDRKRDLRSGNPAVRAAALNRTSWLQEQIRRES